MGSRVQLHSLLEQILGTNKVYFQPPPTLSMGYPCIVYSRSLAKTKYANNNPYNYQIGYVVTVIDANPDSLIPGKIAMLPMCSFDRHFTINNLNHDVYNLYY